MNIPVSSLAELRRICEQSFQKHLSDAELLEVAQRILRFLRNTEGHDPEVPGDVYRH